MTAADDRTYRLLVAAAIDYAIFALDAQGRITTWDTGAQRLKGYTAEEIVGEHFSRFYTAEDRAAGVPQRALAEAISQGRFEAEGWRVRKDGTRFWANVVIDAIREEDGSLVGFAKVTRDMTERRQAQQALEDMRERLAQSQRLEALGRLTGGIAHDFNNLLQVMSSGVLATHKLAGADPRVSRILDHMRTAIARGTAVTKQLLVFGRQAPLQMEVVDSATTLRGAVDLFARSLQNEVAVRLELAPELPPMRIDVTEFELALLNIAINARDAMPQGGTLRIVAEFRDLHGEPEGLTGRFVAIAIADTGAGIPPDVLPRVFEPFYTTKPAGQGTGLGLSQVYGFAHQSKGAVTIASRAGEGTTVTLLLPVADAQPGPSRVEHRAASAARPAGECSVLVVDDDPTIATMTAEMLDDAGYSATSVTDPLVALHWLEDGRKFRLVVSDIIMPGAMNGVQFGREIRRRWPETPVLLATGYASEGESIAREFPVLRKPYSIDDLTKAIEEVQGKWKRAGAELG